MGWICSLTSKTLYVEGGWGQGEKRLLFFCLFPSIFKYMLSSMESGVHDQRGEPLLRVLQSPPSAVLSLGTGAGPADPHFSQAGSEGRGLSVEDLEWPGRGTQQHKGTKGQRTQPLSPLPRSQTPGSPGPSPALSCLAKGGVGGESWRASLPPGVREEGGRKRIGAVPAAGRAVKPSPRHLWQPGRETRPGRGTGPSPSLRGIPVLQRPIFRQSSRCGLPASVLPFPFPESLPSWECQSARCRNLDEQHSLETGSGRRPGQSSRPAPPRPHPHPTPGVKSGEGQGPGAPSVSS